MCGFGPYLLVEIAIAVVVILVLYAIINRAFPGLFASVTSVPYWDIIKLLIGGLVAIGIILIIWRLFQCAGLVHGSIQLPYYG